MATFSETQQDSPREKVELAENSREGRTARAKEGARDTFFIATAFGAVVNFEQVAAHERGREYKLALVLNHRPDSCVADATDGRRDGEGKEQMSGFFQPSR